MRKVLIAALMTCGIAIASPTMAAPRATVADGTLPVTIDGTGYQLAARVYRPAGSGPFPLVVINHGTPPDKSKFPGVELGFVRAAAWFVDHGYMVVTALRPGFGTSSGSYLEAAGRCQDENYVAAGEKTAAVERAIVSAAATLPGADPTQIVVVGQSAGGFGAVALADAPPPGVVGVISFAGGRGGDGKEHICGGEDRLIAAEGHFGAGNRVPQVWLYAANDHFFRRDLAHRMYAAYAGASTPPVTFVGLPSFGDDGHKTFAKADPSVWERPVSSFLKRMMPAAR